ncbi:MAG: VIT1/CCC1 family predicted Fe2+/Mn2+ transporter [Gammaproteobacteria bacterium]|jgi:VIT1/CCC1 family predicted Fe2+/Mn2+ transporter
MDMMEQALRHHTEKHYSHRAGWLRAAVLGANDGIVSTASLIIGVAAANASIRDVLVAGSAGLVAGAMSMAAGEYVSVSAQADSESADLDRERRELELDPEHERHELAQIYEERGLEPDLASQVSEQLMAHDALGAHARDELGLSEAHTARPLQAALASAATFAVGALLPLLVVVAVPRGSIIASVAACSLVFLALLGWTSARAGGAKGLSGMARVMFWGALAMAATAAIGTLVGSLL